jgi:hypothetical protein
MKFYVIEYEKHQDRAMQHIGPAMSVLELSSVRRLWLAAWL